MHALMDRMTELCDRMASASAAQVPIIDALQSVVNKIESPSRQRAEESVRREFGDALYEGLMPMARNMAIAAEYCWLYTNTPNPSRIVADLAAAFEHQLREAVFLPFCETLRSLGVLNYPERPGSSSVRPRPGLPVQLAARGFEMPGLPTLLENGRITRTLTLGSMQKLLERPLPALTNFLAQQRISIQEMMKVLPEIREARNNAVHEGQPSLREEASQIRRRGLGKTEGFPNIFAVLMGDRSGRAAGGGQ
jgi:hypothetical protein